MSAEFTLEGDEEMLAKINRLFPEFKDAAAQGLQDWANDVIALSKADYVPVKDGFLKGSGYADTVKTTDTGLSVQLGYSEVYAAKQHEHMEYRHNIGQAKYLEIPLILKSAELLPRVAKMMDKAAEAVL